MRKKWILIAISLMLSIALFGCARTDDDLLNDKVISNNPGSIAEVQPEENVINEKEEKTENTSESSQPPSNEETKEDSEEATSSPETEKKPLPTQKDSFESVESLMKKLSVDRHIVFKGRKLRTDAAVSVGQISYFPAVIEVLEPYYGKVQKQDTVVLWETLGTVNVESDMQITYRDSELDELESEEEYIFILTAEQDHYTYTYRAHTYTKISDRKAMDRKVQNGTATKLEQFRSSVLETYLNNPDTRLDLYAEASKLFSGIPENATEDEILNALPAEQKALFEDLIEQYGTK